MSTPQAISTKLKGSVVIFTELFKRSQSLMTENSTALLTSVGVVGTVTTAVLTGRASFRSADIIRAANKELNAEAKSMADVVDLTPREKIALVWPQFIPPVGVGGLTITAIIMAHRLSAKEAATLAAAYGVSERAFSEYREKVVERVGQNKETGIHDAIAKDRVEKTPIPAIVPGTGEVLCLDLWTGRYFNSTVETIRKAENDINFEIVNGMYASASTFYDALGLEATEMTDMLGWNINCKLEVTISSQLASDGRPCVTISPTPPVPNFNHLF